MDAALTFHGEPVITCSQDLPGHSMPIGVLSKWTLVDFLDHVVRLFGIHTSQESHVMVSFIKYAPAHEETGCHSSHTKHHSQRREKDRRPQEVNISLPYFHGKYNFETYLDWEMKVEQLFACHHISVERKFPFTSLSFQGYALYWWTSLVREWRIHGDPPAEYWNDLKSAYRGPTRIK